MLLYLGKEALRLKLTSNASIQVRVNLIRGKDTRASVSFSLSLSPLPTPRRLSTKTDHSGSTVLNFQLPEKWENWVLLLKLPCRWYFAMPTCFNFLCVSIIKSPNKSNVRKGRVWFSLWLQAREQQCGIRSSGKLSWSDHIRNQDQRAMFAHRLMLNLFSLYYTIVQDLPPREWCC